MTDDLQRPPLPVWLLVGAGVLVAIVAITVIGWVVSAVFAVVRLAVLVALVFGVVALVRWSFGRRQ
jgi:hypothetical protein